MDIYAAIDIRGGKCVNLIQGDFARETVYYEDPREAARYFLDAGTDWIHIVDMDAARSAMPTHTALVIEIIDLAGSLPVQVGGGIRNLQAVREVLDAGAARAVIGTAAVRDPALVRTAVAAYPGQIAVGVDARNGQVAIEAWAEDSTLTAADLASRAADAGTAALVYTMSSAMACWPNRTLRGRPTSFSATAASWTSLPPAACIAGTTWHS